MLGFGIFVGLVSISSLDVLVIGGLKISCWQSDCGALCHVPIFHHVQGSREMQTWRGKWSDFYDMGV